MSKKYHNPPKLQTDNFYSLKPEQKILKLLGHSVLAPSTHNTQPWKFKIKGSSCQIFIDHKRQLPAADLLKRDMYISLGALIKNLEIAATAYGVFDKVEPSDQTTDLVAEVYFKGLDNLKSMADPSGNLDLIAIHHRSNYRGPFKPLVLNARAKQFIKSDINGVQTHLIDDPEAIKELAGLTAEGLKQAYANPKFRREISSWIKPNTSKQKKGIPGYSLRMPTLASHIIPKVMRFKDIGAKLADLNYRSFITASGVVIISAAEENPLTWLNIGRLAQLIFLEVDKLGGSTSIYVAAVETAELNTKVKKLAGITGRSTPQFLFCIGTPVLPKVYSPRESVKSKLL